MKRVRILLVGLVALMVVGAPIASAAFGGQLDESDDRYQGVQITGPLTVAEHSMSDMDGPLDYYDDEGEVQTIAGVVIGGERPVGVPKETADVLRWYLRKYRHDVRDDHGRQPLIASARGRPGTNTIRVWSYLATLPCLHSPCPHGKERERCEWTEYAHASKCPSSRSPHQIRTGTITWLLNRGWPPEDVAERVNAPVKTIEQHYDKADPDERRRRLLERMEERRRPLINQLDITDDSND